MLAMVVNDDLGVLTPHGECGSIASVLAPTGTGCRLSGLLFLTVTGSATAADKGVVKPSAGFRCTPHGLNKKELSLWPIQCQR